MSVAGADSIHDSVEDVVLPTSNHLFVHRQPEDVSSKGFSETVLEESVPVLKEDAFNGDPSLPDTSTEAHDTANGHIDSKPASTDAVSYATTADNEEKAQHETKVVLESKDTFDANIAASDSVAAENPVPTTIVDENISVSVKEEEEYDETAIVFTTENVIDDAAATAEHKEPSNSESADITEESIADKTINDSAIEIVPPGFEKADEEENDKPQEEVVDAVKGDEVDVMVVVVKDTPEETNYTHIDESQAEERKDIDAAVPTESVVVTESAAPESNEENIQVPITEEDPTVVSAEEDTVQGEQSEAPVVIPEEVGTLQEVVETPMEVNKPEAANNVEVEQEATVVHEAEPVAAEINNVEEDNSHEATNEETGPPAAEVPVEADSVEKSEEEESEITVDVEGASINEESLTDSVEVLDKVEEPAEVQEDEPATTVEVESVAEAAGDEIATPVEAESIAVDQAVLEEFETVVDVTKEESSLPAEAELVEGINEEVPAVIESVELMTEEEAVTPEVEEIVEAESVVEEDTSTPEAGPVIQEKETSAPEGEHAAEEEAVLPVVEPVAEIVREASAPTEVEPIAAEEETPVPEPVVDEETPAPEPIVEEETPVSEAEPIIQEEVPTPAEVPVPVETEPVAEISSEGASISVAEVAEETPTPTPVETEPVIVETTKEEASASVVEVEPTADVHSEAAPEETIKELVDVSSGVTAPVEAQVEEVQEGSSINDSIPTVEIAQEEAVEETYAEEVKEITPDEAESDVVHEVTLPEADDAKVANESTSVALATSTAEQTPSAIETADETSEEADEQSTSAPVENGPRSISEPPAETATAAGESVDVEVAPIEERLAEVPDVEPVMPDDSATEIEPLTELNTETLFIQTSLDTTSFTPVVDSGIELKEQESQPSQLLSIAEEVERPKSPWSPSFHVTTIGRGELPEKEDPIQDAAAGSEMMEDTTKSVVVSTVEVVVAEKASATVASEDLPFTDGQSLEPPTGPWTPSYSVHLQGSPMHATKELTSDIPVVDEPVASEEAAASEQNDEPVISESVAEVAEETTLNIEVAEIALNDVVEQATKESIGEVAVVDEGANEEPELTSNEQMEANLSVETLEPPARPWTPSYSVHAQGSPLQPLKELGIAAENAVESTRETQAEEDQYSVQAQDTVVEQITEVVAVIPVITVDNEEIVTEVSLDETVEDAENERPAKSWTPSYSVHDQGVKSAQLEEVTVPAIDPEPLEIEDTASNDSLEPPAAETKPPALSVTESPESALIDAVTETWTPSYSVHSQGSPMIASKELEEESEPLEQGSPIAPAKELEEPSSETQPLQSSESETLEPSAEPWSSSYSVHSQGTPLITSKELEEVSKADIELSTSAESNESAQLDYAVHSQGTPSTISKELEDIPVGVEPAHQNEDTSTDALDEQKGKGAEAILATGFVPIIAVAAIGAPMEAQAAVEEQQETSARPWTPSYSAHSQGSPILSPVILTDEQVPDINLTYDVQQAITDAPEFGLQLNSVLEPPSESQAASPWVPSYSVRMQGTPTVEKSEADMFSGTTKQPDTKPAEISGADVTLSADKITVPILSVLVDETVTDESNNSMADIPERPKSPWTPSYSVTKLGAGLSGADEEELDRLEPLTQSVTKSHILSDSEPQLNEVQDSDAVRSRSGYDVAVAEDLAKNERFMLFGLRAIVAYLWVLPNWLSMTRSSEGGHGREASSASSTSSSSKIFPGGWLTSKANQGRTSLDVAQGEFASPKTASSTDVFESFNANVASNEIDESSVADSDADGQRRKWCVVM